MARLQTWRALIFSRVCLSVCLCVCLLPALLPFNVDRFWWNLVTRTLLWSSLAATIMVQICRRVARATLFWKFQKKIQKSQNSNLKILVHHFLRLCLLCIVKKFGLDSNKIDGGDRFWSLPLWRFRQWHCYSSTTLGGIFWLSRSKLGGIPNWGRNRAVKTNRHVCLCVCLFVREDIFGTTRTMFTKFLGMLPMSVARPPACWRRPHRLSAGKVTGVHSAGEV